MHLDEKKVPAVFKALCDENRVQILNYLLGGEKCACRLLEDLQIAQSTLSHHMKILTDSGLVLARREGKWTHYSISEAGVAIAVGYLQALQADLRESEQSCCGA